MFRSIINRLKEMRISMSFLSSSLLVLTILLELGKALDWQGTGNMSESNMTQVSTYFHSNFQTSWKQASLLTIANTSLIDFTKGLSDHLNDLWKPAWNVFLVYIYGVGVNSDSLVYGYGFRDHWLWFNGVKMDDNYHASLIIWKDYNCVTWVTYNPSTTGSKTTYTGTTQTAVETMMTDAKSSISSSELWTAAKTYSDNLQKNPLFPNSAFTVIMSQEGMMSAHFGRFCCKDYYYSTGGSYRNWGRAFILQMR